MTMQSFPPVAVHDPENGKPIALERGYDSHYALVSKTLNFHATTNSFEHPKNGVGCRMCYFG